MIKIGFFGKLAFWKKNDGLDDIDRELGFDKNLGMDFTSGPSPDLGAGMDNPPQIQQQYPKYSSLQQSQPNFQPSFQQPAFNSNLNSNYNSDNYINSKNLEVISSKIDAMRASLESMNQRLANIEAIARGEQEDTRRRRYY